MIGLGSLAFLNPWLLLGLLGLPLILIILRVLPPSPRRQAFPPIEILRRAKLLPPRSSSIPWWLILLRLLALALIILACARPVLNPGLTLGGQGPVLVVLDDGWASAPTWPQQREALRNVLERAGREGRGVVLATTAPTEPATAPRVADPEALLETLPSLQPKPWPVDRAGAQERVEALGLDAARVVWLSDGLAEGGAGRQEAADLAAGLARLGEVTTLAPAPADLATLVLPPALRGQDLVVPVRRADAAAAVGAIEGLDADENVVARAEVAFDAGGGAEANLLGEAVLDVPADLRGRITGLSLAPMRGLGDTLLLDERFGAKSVGIVTPLSEETRPLLSETYFIERALGPFAAVRRGDLTELLETDPSLLILPDQRVASNMVPALEDWIEKGGVLLRFAGPDLAAGDDALVPVPLRQGERFLDGALSWSEPLRIARFAEDGPFAGIAPSPDVRVRRQVLATPGPDLDRATLASLEDGTPIATGRAIGAGHLILIHTGANTRWSDLPLSRVFVDMLNRGLDLAEGGVTRAEGRFELVRAHDAFGRLATASSGAVLDGGALDEARPGPSSPPGVYARVDDPASQRALSLQRGVVDPVALPPAGSAYGTRPAEVALTPLLLLLALLLFFVETVLTARLRGYWPWFRPAGTTAALLLGLALAAPTPARADVPIELAAQETRLAYIETGELERDRMTAAGLSGLTQVTRQRTSVEMVEPAPVDPEIDELSVYPLIYWSLGSGQADLPPEARANLDRYMRLGGLLLIDTGDAGTALPGYADAGPGMTRLREVLRDMDVPPLVPLPAEHVLTRSFYLLQDAPGRAIGGTVWVDEVAADVNDGVSSLVIGSNDWAGAWAEDGFGRPMLPVAPGGERQREMARRFGVNLVMYALTGNYKTDQVHIPAILERLGQ